MRITVKIAFVALGLLGHFLVWAQDERQVRQLLGEDFRQQELNALGLEDKRDRPAKWTAYSRLYRHDIDGDGKQESLLIERKDARVHVHLFDHYNKPLGRHDFKADGAYAEVVKVHVRTMAPGIHVLIFHFYSGKTEYTEYYAKGQLYFALFQNHNKNIPKLQFSEGPAYYEEQFDGQKHYHKKPYIWELHDYNNDGIQEIIVTYNKIKRIYIYTGEKLVAL